MLARNARSSERSPPTTGTMWQLSRDGIKPWPLLQEFVGALLFYLFFFFILPSFLPRVSKSGL